MKAWINKNFWQNRNTDFNNKVGDLGLELICRIKKALVASISIDSLVIVIREKAKKKEKKKRNMLNQHEGEKLVHVFITSELDSSKVLLTGCHAASLGKFQLILNSAV